jgi:hypothetical protein
MSTKIFLKSSIALVVVEFIQLKEGSTKNGGKAKAF